MTNTTKTLFLGALMAGLVAGTGAFAADEAAADAKPAAAKAAHAKKHCNCKKNKKHCKCDKDGCDGKDGCNGKDKKKD